MVAHAIATGRAGGNGDVSTASAVPQASTETRGGPRAGGAVGGCSGGEVPSATGMGRCAVATGRRSRAAPVASSASVSACRRQRSASSIRGGCRKPYGGPSRASYSSASRPGRCGPACMAARGSDSVWAWRKGASTCSGSSASRSSRAPSLSSAGGRGPVPPGHRPVKPIPAEGSPQAGRRLMRLRSPSPRTSHTASALPRA
jgi:hypothetical protein